MGLLADTINQFVQPIIATLGSTNILGFMVCIIILIELFAFQATLEILIFTMGLMISALTFDGIFTTYVPVIILGVIGAAIILYRFKELNEG